MAISNRTTLPLSRLFRDPRLAAAFERAERDNGAAFAVPLPVAPVLTGGAAVELELA